MIDLLLTIGLIAMCMAAVWSDVRTGRIPNVLTLSGLALALALRTVSGLGPLGAGLSGALLALLLSIPLFLIGGLGGGDVKLLVAVGAFLAPSQLFVALAVTAITGGFIALIAVIRKRALGRTLANAWRIVKTAILAALFRTVPRSPLPTVRTPGAITTPYGVAIAAGAIVGVLL
jgi:prepilin peptidase CpaA